MSKTRDFLIILVCLLILSPVAVCCGVGGVMFLAPVVGAVQRASDKMSSSKATSTTTPTTTRATTTTTSGK